MDIMKKGFTANLFGIGMRSAANEIAKDGGLSGDQIDAFRHAYVSAKMQEAFGKDIAEGSGRLNESGRDRINRATGIGTNPESDWKMDLRNNQFGLQLEEELATKNLSPAEKERLLREGIRDAVVAGKLQLNPIPGDKLPNGQTSGKRMALDAFFTFTSGGKPDFKGEMIDGELYIKAYNRSTGEVKGHTRTRPDGEVGNNKSFKFKK